MKAALLILILSALFGTASSANAACFAADSNDSFARMTCPNYSSEGQTYCEMQSQCRWADGDSGSCGPRDRNDSFARMTCPNYSSEGKTYCEMQSQCVWND
ncbi:MAG: hypothetical protein ACXWR1_09815 [Bdellovibrionota bacterium]